MIRNLVCVIFLMFLSGCDTDSFLQKIASLEQQEIAKRDIELLRSGDFDKLEGLLDPSIKLESVRETLRQMSKLIPENSPTAIKLVGAEKSLTKATTVLNLTFEYEFPEKWLLINVARLTEGESTTIVGINVVPQVASLETQNRFSLSGKTSMHYAVLASGVVALIVSLVSLAICIGTPLKKRKWPWILFILAGVGTFSINWATGQWMFSPLSLQLLSVSAMETFYGPWIIAVSMPIGAIVFLIRRRRLMLYRVEA